MSRPPTEDELVERARGGDAAAFAALVRDHEEIAFRTAYLIARNAADAEDAAQVGLTKAWRALPRFRRGAPFRPWLLAIVANEARNRRRAEGRREGLALRAAHELPSGDAAPSPEGRALAAEERAELARRARAAERGRPRRALVPLPARPRRGGDRRGALAPARHRQVADVAGARTPARAAGGDGMNELERRLAGARRRDRLPGDAAASTSASSAGPCARRALAAARARLRDPARRARRRARVLAGSPQRLPRDLPHPRRDRRAGRDAARGRGAADRLRRARQPGGGRAPRRLRARSTSAEPDAIFVRAGPARLASSTAIRASRGSCSRSCAARSATGSSRRPAGRGTTDRGGRRSAASPASSSRATSTSSCSGTRTARSRTSATYLAGTVLLWNRGPLLLRLEGDLTRGEALELAKSVE